MEFTETLQTIDEYLRTFYNHLLMFSHEEIHSIKIKFWRHHLNEKILVTIIMCVCITFSG